MDHFKASLEIYALPKADITHAIMQYLENEGISAYTVTGIMPSLQSNRDSIQFPVNMSQANSDLLYNQIVTYFKPIHGLVSSIGKPLLISTGGGAFNEYFINLSNLARSSFCSGLDSLDDFDKKRGIPKFRNCIWAIDEIGSNCTEKDKALRDMAYGFSYLALYFFKESEESTVGFSNLMGFLNEASKYFSMASNCQAFNAVSISLSDICIAIASAKISKDHEDRVQDEPNKGHFGRAIAYAKRCVSLTQKSLNIVVWDTLKGKAENFSLVMQPKIANMEHRNAQIYKDQVPSDNSCILPEVSSKVISQLSPFPDSKAEFAEILNAMKGARINGYITNVQGLIAKAKQTGQKSSTSHTTHDLAAIVHEKKEESRILVLNLKGMIEGLIASGKKVYTQQEKVEKFEMKFFQADGIDIVTNKQYENWKISTGSVIDQNTIQEHLAFASNFSEAQIIERVNTGEAQGLKGEKLDDFVLAPVTSKLNLILNSGGLGANEELNNKFNNGLSFYEGLNIKLREPTDPQASSL